MNTNGHEFCGPVSKAGSCLLNVSAITDDSLVRRSLGGGGSPRHCSLAAGPYGRGGGVGRGLGVGVTLGTAVEVGVGVAVAIGVGVGVGVVVDVAVGVGVGLGAMGTIAYA